MHIYYEHPYGKIEKGFLQYVKVYAKPQSFEHQTALESGFVYSNDHGKEIWLQTRNTRCVLSEFNKPDPRHLTDVVEIIGGDLKKTIMVGDSEVDVATAKAADVPIALFTQGYRQTSVAELAPDFDFDNFKSLPVIAASFFASIA